MLCSTCLRPLDDITSYKDMKFDECPHCNAYIPPIFTPLDFVRHQASLLLPALEEDAVTGKKKKRGQSEAETRLVHDLMIALIAYLQKLGSFEEQTLADEDLEMASYR